MYKLNTWCICVCTSLASHAPNTSNLGSGRDQYTNWFRAANKHLQRELERERGGGREREREKGIEGEMTIR